MSLNNVYVEETSDVDFEYSIKAFVASEVFVWMVGLLDMMSLSGLHSWMEVVRLVMFNGG